jgi:hypothetical protein
MTPRPLLRISSPNEVLWSQTPLIFETEYNSVLPNSFSWEVRQISVLPAGSKIEFLSYFQQVRAILIVVFFNISFDFNLFSSIFSEVDLIVSRYFKSHFNDLCRLSLEFWPVCLLHRSRHCSITQLFFFYRTIITAFSHNRDGIRFFPKKNLNSQKRFGPFLNNKTRPNRFCEFRTRFDFIFDRI